MSVVQRPAPSEPLLATVKPPKARLQPGPKSPAALFVLSYVRSRSIGMLAELTATSRYVVVYRPGL